MAGYIILAVVMALCVCIRIFACFWRINSQYYTMSAGPAETAPSGFRPTPEERFGCLGTLSESPKKVRFRRRALGRYPRGESPGSGCPPPPSLQPFPFSPTRPSLAQRRRRRIYIFIGRGGDSICWLLLRDRIVHAGSRVSRIMQWGGGWVWILTVSQYNKIDQLFYS